LAGDKDICRTHTHNDANSNLTNLEWTLKQIVGSGDLRQMSEYPPMESTAFLHPEEEIQFLIDLPQG
jgi:hypothetical protein